MEIDYMDLQLITRISVFVIYGFWWLLNRNGVTFSRSLSASARPPFLSILLEKPNEAGRRKTLKYGRSRTHTRPTNVRNLFLMLPKSDSEAKQSAEFGFGRVIHHKLLASAPNQPNPFDSNEHLSC